MAPRQPLDLASIVTCECVTPSEGSRLQRQRFQRIPARLTRTAAGNRHSGRSLLDNRAPSGQASKHAAPVALSQTHPSHEPTRVVPRPRKKQQQQQWLRRRPAQLTRWRPPTSAAAPGVINNPQGLAGSPPNSYIRIVCLFFSFSTQRGEGRGGKDDGLSRLGGKHTPARTHSFVALSRNTNAPERAQRRVYATITGTHARHTAGEVAAAAAART